jgi:hypothetical protein
MRRGRLPGSMRSGPGRRGLRGPRVHPGWQRDNLKSERERLEMARRRVVTRLAAIDKALEQVRLAEEQSEDDEAPAEDLDAASGHHGTEGPRLGRRRARRDD